MKPSHLWISGNHNVGDLPLTETRRTRKALASAVRSCIETLETRQLLTGVDPVAVTGGPYTVNEGSSVAISGSGSSDADGTIVSYKWDLNYNAGLGFRTSITGAGFTYHAADGAATRTIALRVTDNDGNIVTETTTLVSNNVAPTLTLVGGESTAEGQTYTLSWTKTDPGQDTVSGYQIDWGDGTSATSVAGNISTADHVFNDPGSMTVTLTATDEDGTASSTKTVTVTTVNPVVTLVGDSSVYEGSAYQILFESTDAGGDGRDGWVIDWGDGDVGFYDATLSTSTHSYADDGNYLVTVTSQASDGDTGTDTINLNVLNENPTVAITGTPSSAVDEGTAVSFGSTVSDPGTDTFTYGWTVYKDGEQYTLPGGTDITSSTFTFTPEDNGVYHVRLTVQDEDGGETTVNSDDFTVSNVAPTVAVSGEPGSAIDEGDAITLTATAADEGGDDTHTYAWTATRDGEAHPLEGVDTTSSSINFTTLDNGVYIFTVVVTDDDEATSTDSSDAITVNNVAPTGTISGEPGSTIDEGAQVNLTVTPADAGDADAMSYAWTVTRDGNAFTLHGEAVTDQPSFSFVPTDEGSYVATVVITDDDGGTVSVDSSAITVSNAAPTGTISGAPSTSTEGAPITLTAIPADAGANDTFTYSWAVTKDGDPFNLPGGTDTSSAEFTFTPTDDGDYVATVTISDNDGDDVAVSTSTISITNVSPDATITGLPGGDVTEGDSVSVSASVTDAGADDTLTYAWSVTKDEQPFTLPGGTDVSSSTFSFTPTDDGEYVISLTVQDDNGGESNYSAPAITVVNAAPTVAITGEPGASIDEGDTINLTATPTDAGEGDTFSYQWTVTRDGEEYYFPQGVDTNSVTLSFTTTNDGAYIISVQVIDDDGAGATDSSSSITVDNVAPTGSISAEPGSSINEGTPITLSVSAADAGDDDALSYSWTLTKDGNPVNLPENSITDATEFTFTPTDEGSYVATCTVTDDDGGSVEIDSDAITVDNAAPTATVSGEPSETIDEGDSITLTATASDAGADDTLSYSWSVSKDGNPYTLPNEVVTNAAQLTFSPDDEGTFVATVAISDGDSGSVSVDSANIVVNNVAPGVTITGTPSTSVDEGTAVTLGSTVTDAGATDIVATYAWSVTRDGNAFTLPGGTDTASSSFTFTPTDNGEYEVSLTVTDNDGGSTTELTTFTVVNLAPTASISGEPGSAIDEGTAVTLTATPADAGSADTFTYAWSVTRDGEGYDLEGALSTDDEFTFTPRDNGTYLATCVITDDDGASVTVASDTITVDNVAPTGTISGAPVGNVNEGSGITVSITGDDAGDDDALSYSWSVTKDGNPFILPGETVTDDTTFSFTPTDNGDFIISCQILDDDGGTTTVSTATITVVNVAPTGSILSNTGENVFEGDPLEFTAVPADAGAADTFGFAWSVTRDGNPYTLPNGTDVSSETFSFSPSDNGDYVISVEITDDDGGSVIASSSTISVLNANPVPIITGAPETAVEGDTLSFGSNVTDPGSADTTFTYSWSVTRDGEAFALPGGTVTNGDSFSFVPMDNGSYVVTLGAADKDGGTDSTTRTITISNANPTATITGEPGGAIDEGSAVSLTVNPADAGEEDTFSYQWSVTLDGEAFALPDGTDVNSGSFAFTPRDNGDYLASVIVTDDDDGSVTATSNTITVNNVAPTGSVSGEPITADEGDEITLTANPSDVGEDDTFSYSWSVSKNGNAFTLPDGTATTGETFTFVPTDNGDFTASVVITDDDGGSVTVDSDEISAGNVNPTGTVTGEPDTSPEGTAITVSANPADAGSADTFSYSWSVTKDGNAFALPGGTDTTAASLELTPTDSGDFVATVVISDDDGGSVSVDSSTMSITNLAPAVTINGAPGAAINEGAAVSLTTSISDAGSDDTVASYAWSVTHDGEAYDLGNTTVNASSFSFAPNDNGVFVVSLTVADDDGGETTESKTISVNNVNPTVSVTGLPGSSIAEGTAVNLTANASDSGSADELTYEWSVRKNGQVYSLDGVTTDASTFSFAPNDNGSFVFTVIVTDDDGGAGLVNTSAITVTNAAPTATLTGEPESAIAEGTAVSLSVSATDAGSTDILSYSWSVTKDGNAYSLSGVTTNQADFTFTPNDEGDFVASCVITDDDGGSVTKTSETISVTNANPTASIAGMPDGPVTEGTTVNLTANAADAGSADTLEYAWTVTRNGDPFATGDEESFSFTATDNGEYLISLTVTDNDGGSVEAEAQTISVTNVTPSVSITGLPESLIEGDEVTLGVEISDPSSVDTDATFAVDWTILKDGEEFISGTGETFSFTPTDDGEYAISVSAADKDEAAGIDNATLAVGNADPEAEITGAPESAGEGETISLSSAITDAGSVDTETGFTQTWSVQRDGNTFELPDNTDVNSSEFVFTPTDNGVYVISLSVSDKDGGLTSASATIDVGNVTPDSVAITGALNSSLEGTVISVAGTAADAGDGDTLSYAWTVTKGEAAYTTGSGQNFSFTPNDNGSYIISLVVTDDDGDSAEAVTTSVTVTNAVPTGGISTTFTGVRGRETSFIANVSDAGTADAVALSINWGDGTTPEVRAVNSSATLNLAHAYATAGTFPVSMTMVDDDGGTRVVNTTVTVRAAAIQTDPMDSTKTALIVGGTASDDVIKFVLNTNGRIKTTVNGELLGTFAPTGHIIAYGDAGNNSIIVDKTVVTPAVLYGGSGKDSLFGGSGDDILIGRKGNDALSGSDGRDILIGGVGADNLLGGNGEDILIGGSTAGAESFSALDLISDEWSRTDSIFVNRIKHLKGSLAGGLNGSTKLTDGTVFEDEQADSMTGGAGRDWFFTNINTGTIERILDYSVVDDSATNVGVTLASSPKA